MSGLDDAIHSSASAVLNDPNDDGEIDVQRLGRMPIPAGYASPDVSIAPPIPLDSPLWERPVDVADAEYAKLIAKNPQIGQQVDAIESRLGPLPATTRMSVAADLQNGFSLGQVIAQLKQIRAGTPAPVPKKYDAPINHMPQPFVSVAPRQAQAPGASGLDDLIQQSEPLPAASSDGLDSLIHASAQGVFGGPDFSDVSGSATSTVGGGLPRPAEMAQGSPPEPDFSDVSGEASSSTDHLPTQAAPPAPAGLDRDFMHWYANYVKATGATLSYDQARQLYKSMTPAQRAAAKSANESWIDRYRRENNMPPIATAAQNREALSDELQNIASGMKQGVDFVAHLPDYAAKGIASVPFSVNAALTEADNRRRLEQAISATTTTGEDYITPEMRRQAEHPAAQMPPGSAFLPDIAEETFQSVRDERERLQEQTARHGVERGASPEAAAMAYAIPQTVGNILDPTMLLGSVKAARMGERATSLLDRLVAHSADEELGARAAADVAEPALTRAVAPSEELRQRFPEATIDSREFVEPGSERRAAATGQPLPAPPEGIKPGDPWLQRERARSAEPPAVSPPSIVDLHGAGQAIADNLYAGMWERLEAGKLPEPFPPTQQSTAARIVAEAYGRGEIRGPEDIRNFVNDYARRTYGQNEAAPALRPQERFDADVEASVSGTNEKRRPAAAAQGIEGEGEVVAPGGRAGQQPAGYRGSEGDLAPGAEGAGGPQSGQRLAPGGGPEALPAGDRGVAEGAGGQPLETGTALNRAYTDAERAERGLSPVEREFFGTTDETMAKARDVIEADPAYPRRLAQGLIDTGRLPRPHEAAELLYDKAKILNEEKAAMDALEAARASGDVSAEADARLALERARGDLDANTEASRRSLSQWGELGRLSQQVIREDYSVSRVLQRARAAEPAGQITPELEKKLADLAGRVEATSKALDAARDDLAQVRVRKALAAMQREAALEGRRAARRQVRQTLDEELADLSSQLENRAKAKQGKLFSTTNPFQGLDPESIALIGKIAKNRVKAGVNNVGDLVDSVYNIVRNHFNGITPRDVRDAISGYGQAPKGSRAIALSRLAKLNREMRLLSKIEDAEAGQMPARGAARAPKAPEIKALEKRLRDTMRQRGLDRNMRLDAYRARLTSQKADLERQLATGDFTPVGRPLAVEDASTRQLKVEIEKLKQRVDTEVKKIERANWTPAEKARNLLLKWRRGLLLSSTQTVGKLLSAAEVRTLATTPVEQLIGAGWAHVPGVSRIAAMAPREGTVSLSAEAKAWASAFSKETWKDAWESGMPEWAGGRGTGKNELDILYGKKSDFPPEVLDFFGHLHAGLKTLAKRPEFERSLALRYKHAAMQGLDASLPEVQAEIAAKAYADAQRAVLLQDNGLVDAFRTGQEVLRKRGYGGLATTSEFLLPIVKVPTNYITEAAEYGLGPMRALKRVIWQGGIENLEEHDAEYIMRNLKKGTLGTSLLALGYYGYDKIGGYRQRNEHREEGEVQPMTIRMNLFGHQVDIPHALLHAPALEMLQVGATLRRLQIAFAERHPEKGTSNAVLAGGLGGVRGLAEQVPFYGELLRTQEGLASPSGFQNYFGNLGRSIFLPPDVQRFAQIHDQEERPGPFTWAVEQLGLKHFEPIRRYPQYFFWDQFKTGIPWAREQVSDEKNP